MAEGLVVVHIRGARLERGKLAVASRNIVIRMDRDE